MREWSSKQTNKLIALIILSCDKQKQVCDLKFITIFMTTSQLFYVYNYG